MAGEKIELMVPIDREYIKSGSGLDELKGRSETYYGEDGNYAEYRNSSYRHEGIDLTSGLIYLQPVTSIYDGKVAYVGLYGDSNNSSIIIEHEKIKFTLKDKVATYTQNPLTNNNNCLLSNYVHMRFIVPIKGNSVKKGEVIGFMGGLKGEAGAGNTDAMHLHFGLGIKYFNQGLSLLGGEKIANDPNKPDKYNYSKEGNYIDPFLDKDYPTLKGGFGYIDKAKDIFEWKVQSLNLGAFDFNKFQIFYSKIMATNASSLNGSKYSGGNIITDSNFKLLSEEEILTSLNVRKADKNKGMAYKTIFYAKYIDIYYNDNQSIPERCYEINYDKLVNIFLDQVWGKEDTKKGLEDERDKKGNIVKDENGNIKIIENGQYFDRAYTKKFLLDYFTLAFRVFKFPEEDIEYGDFYTDKKTMEDIGYKGKIQKLGSSINDIFDPLKKVIIKLQNIGMSDVEKYKKIVVDTITLLANHDSGIVLEKEMLFTKKYNDKFIWYKNNIPKAKEIKTIKDHLGNLIKNLNHPIETFSNGLVSLRMLKYAGYVYYGKHVIEDKPVPNYASVAKKLVKSMQDINPGSENKVLQTLEEKIETQHPEGETERRIPKELTIDDFPRYLDSRIITPNTPLEKKFVGVTTQTIQNGIMEFINMGKSGLGTGGDKAGGAGGTPSKGGSAATAKSTGKNTGITPLGKDKYNKMPEQAKPKTVNTNPAPKTNNLLGGKNKPGANSWQDMVKGTFGSLAAGAGKGNISGTKATAPQQGAGALAKAKTASQPYPALNGMKNAGMPPNPGTGFQTPTIPNSAMPAQKTDGSMKSSAPTSIPSLTSASYKPQLPNTNYIPESTPKGNTVKDKIKPDSQPGKPKLTEITIKGENADRYELMARELPSMWERYEKESAQRLI